MTLKIICNQAEIRFINTTLRGTGHKCPFVFLWFSLHVSLALSLSLSHVSTTQVMQNQERSLQINRAQAQALSGPGLCCTRRLHTGHEQRNITVTFQLTMCMTAINCWEMYGNVIIRVNWNLHFLKQRIQFVSNKYYTPPWETLKSSLLLMSTCGTVNIILYKVKRWCLLSCFL